MSADRARLLELAAACRFDVEAMAAASDRVGELRAAAPEPADDAPEVILYGYHLHQWYNAAESCLVRIAAHFGNEVEPSEWHRGLLERLRHAVPDLRPAVIGAESFHHLNALRGFRHVFRHTYGYALRWDLMRPNVERLPAADREVRGDLERFLAFVDELARAA